MRTLLVFVLFLVTLSLRPAAATAQELGPEVEAQARAAFAEGQSQFEAGNHQLALDAFQRMHDLMSADPRAQAMVSYNIALCLDRLERLEEALTSYERFLAEAPPDAPYRDRASDRVRELRSRAEFRASRETEQSTAEESEPEAETQAAPQSVMVPIGIAVISVGAAALLAAIPTGVLALDGETHLEAACPGGACPAEEQGRIDETRTLGILTDVLWVSGALIAAAGASLLVVGLMEGGGDAPETSVTPEVACTPQGCVAGVRGQF